jgi:pyruvate dehydrogenase (quinone)
MTQRIPEVNYAAFADLIGLKGIRVETPDEIEGAWDQAFSSDRPVVVDALCDPSVPPLPPHISVKQARAFVSALRKGDPHGREVITQSFKEKILEFLPGR